MAASRPRGGERHRRGLTEELVVDPEQLREQVRDKYREVATDPHARFHFHTGRPLADRLGYDEAFARHL